MGHAATVAIASTSGALGAVVGGSVLYFCCKGNNDADSTTSPTLERVMEQSMSHATPTTPDGPPSLLDGAEEPPRVHSIVSGYGAFAMLAHPCRTLHCWGSKHSGGEAPRDCPPLETVVATRDGFAALTTTDSTPNDVPKLIIWGDLSVHREDILREVPSHPTHIASTERSVCVENAAGDGILFGAWGVVRYDALRLRGLRSTEYADVAYMELKDSFFALGEASYGSKPPYHTAMTDKVYSTAQAFAAVGQDGKVVAWGAEGAGGGGAPDVSDVVDVYATSQAFAAVTVSGALHAWGNPAKGGALSAEAQARLGNNVSSVAATRSAFAAIAEGGRVVVWGAPNFGGDQGAADRALSGKRVKLVKATGFAFAALCEDGTVAAWGDPELGGTISAMKAEAIGRDAVELFAGERVFGVVCEGAAGPETRTAVTWGQEARGGASPEEGVTQNTKTLHIGDFAVVAVKRDGSAVAWGDKDRGGNIGER